MRIFVDSASLSEIEEWAEHPWVSGFTTNPTLMRANGIKQPALGWSPLAVKAARGKPISIDGPVEVWDLGENVYRKVIVPKTLADRTTVGRTNYTAACYVEQFHEIPGQVMWLGTSNIVSVFAGRIMDTGRDPQPVIDAAKQTGAQVLWASVREPYNIVMAEQAGCDIVTVPPAILRKYLEWNGKPLEVVAEETIAQFDRDREGLW